MRVITVNTSVVQLAPAGNRDFIGIFNNAASGGNILYVCFDGDDGTNAITTTLSTGFTNGSTVKILTVANVSGIQAGQLITGTGVPAGTYVQSVVVDPVYSQVTVNVNFTASANSDAGSYTFGQVALTTSNGFPIPPQTNILLSNDSHRNVWNKAVYAIASGAGTDVRIQGA
jgi:hypothetical protein